MKTIKNLLNLLILSALCSCSSSTTIKINSAPEGAKIFVKNMSSKSSEEIGVTPLIIKTEDLEKKKLKDGPLFVELKKEGYEDGKVLLAETEAINIDLSLKLDPKDQLAEAKKYDKISAQLFEVQRLIRNKNYKEALEITGAIKKDFPELSVPNELEGSIFYLQNDFEKSLTAFNTAYTKNSENSFVLKMKRLILEKKNIGKK
ncbi:hypothetical protein [Halobacteriovorax sp.]|uniref:hypothetical protein n=1 Tax=Halobacteriovorax sp. TaxID=2020862 RepID=UPI00356A85F8